MERWERERERLDTHTYTKAEGARNWQMTMCQWQLLEVIFSLLQIKQEHCIHTETMAFAFSIERYSTRLATCLSCDIQFLTSGASLSLTLALYRQIPMTIGISMFRFHILYAFCAYTDIQNCRSTTSISHHSPQHSAPLGKFLTMRTPIALKRNRNCSKWCEDEDKLRILLF